MSAKPSERRGITFEPGAELPTLTVEITRADLIRYAGASGDFNPIHWSDDAATAIGLPGVVAHGMYTMALAARAVTDVLDDPGDLVSYGVRFTKPVAVPADGAATLTVTAKVGTVDADAGTARIDLTVTAADVKVLGQARAVVRLP